MGQTKATATGKGYLGAIMVHRNSGVIGVVDSVIEAQVGWQPQITLKLRDGSVRKGHLGEFKDASATQRKKFATNPESGATTPAIP